MSATDYICQHEMWWSKCPTCELVRQEQIDTLKSITAPRITHIECADPGDEQPERTILFSDHAAAVARLKEAGDKTAAALRVLQDAVPAARNKTVLAAQVNEALAAWQMAKEIG